jgi:hypothetical protein
MNKINMKILLRELFGFSKAFRPTLEPTQPRILWIPVVFPGSKAAGA